MAELAGPSSIWARRFRLWKSRTSSVSCLPAVSARTKASQPEQCSQLVADERFVGGDRPQRPHQVPVACIGGREAGLGHRHGGYVDAEMLGPGLGGEEVGLAAPMEIRHQVRGWRGVAQSVAVGQLVRQREGHVVPADRVEVDGGARELLVAGPGWISISTVFSRSPPVP